MIAHYLYRITMPDGRSYIGRSDNPTRRFSEHCSNTSYVGAAIRLYGPENCKLRIYAPARKSTFPRWKNLPFISSTRFTLMAIIALPDVVSTALDFAKTMDLSDQQFPAPGLA